MERSEFTKMAQQMQWNAEHLVKEMDNIFNDHKSSFEEMVYVHKKEMINIKNCLDEMIAILKKDIKDGKVCTND